jgi:hypothetical protein
VRIHIYYAIASRLAPHVAHQLNRSLTGNLSDGHFGVPVARPGGGRDGSVSGTADAEY